jgi:hypothetical protein
MQQYVFSVKLGDFKIKIQVLSVWIVRLGSFKEVSMPLRAYFARRVSMLML